jgi:hypothetical protein
MTQIFDRTITRQILGLTCDILREKFFYDNDALKNFLHIITGVLGEELEFFEENAREDVLDELYRDKVVRLYFTCYFVSAHLREVFIHDLHFTEQELKAFEAFLPKYTGEANYEKQQQQSKCQGTYYRKFFE